MIHRTKKKTMIFFLIYCTFAVKQDNNVKSKILSSLLNNDTKKNKEIVIWTTF